MQSLASANANEECKRVIHALPGAQPTLSQMIEACSKIGTSANVAAIQANIMGEQSGKHQEAADPQDNSTRVMATELAKRPCFKCGKFGHIKKYCPQTAGNTEALPKMQERETLCKSVSFQTGRRCKTSTSPRKLKEERGTPTR